MMLDIAAMGPHELLLFAGATCVAPQERLAILRNPRTPVEGLLWLGSLDPVLFFRHRSVRLMLATDPHFLAALPPSLQAALALFPTLCGAGVLRRLLALNPSGTVVEAIAASPRLDDDLARALVRRAPRVRVALAARPELAKPLVAQLARDANSGVRRMVAGRSDLGAALALGLAEDLDSEVRWVLAGNPRCPRSVLRALSDDDNGAVVQRVGRTLCLA